MEQINMFNEIEISNKEKSNIFFNNVLDILTAKGLTELKLKYRSTKAYELIYFEGKPADIRVKFGDKKSFFSVPIRYEKALINLSSFKYDNSKRWLIIEINNPSDAYRYKKLFCDIYDKRFLETSSDSFDCCSRYMSCSEAGTCVNNLKEVYKYCRYRSKLAQGIVFYGSKRTIK